MFRLSVLLCAAIFATLLIAGEDKGQLRPGLAAAVASGEGIIVLERKAAPALPVVEAEPVLASAAPVIEPVEGAQVSAASFTPTPVAAPTQAEPAPAPVFTLSALPTTRMETAVEPVSEPASAPTPAMGEVWYVTAKSVNVREAPTTDSSVMGKLTRGEAVSVRFEEGSEWAHVLIEGDGLEGYVAMRFLSPTAN